MIGDGECDQNCNNPSCLYDMSDCECAPGCSLTDSNFDYCSDECMDLRCDQFDQVRQCSDIDKKKQNFYIQMLYEDFEARFDIDECLRSDSDCSIEDFQYHNSYFYNYTWNYYGWEFYQQCQTEECTYLRPYYNSTFDCNNDCSTCVEFDICLECRYDKVQYFTKCVDSCPYGFEPIEVSFLDPKVCVSNI
jgi:hypothetical protein